MTEGERGEIARARREAVALATRVADARLKTALKLGEQLTTTTIRQRAVMEQVLAHLKRKRYQLAEDLLQRVLMEEKNGGPLPTPGLDPAGAAQDAGHEGG